MATATATTPKSVENAIRRVYKKTNVSINKLFADSFLTNSFVDAVNNSVTERNRMSVEQIRTITRRLYRRGSANGGLPSLSR